MKICVLASWLLVSMIRAQDVPPPPRPASAPPSIDTTAKFLQEKLSSIGRVNWTETARKIKTNEVTGPAPAWEELTRVTINQRTCEMKVAWKASIGEAGGAFFLEELGDVEVLNAEELTNRMHPGTQYTMSPAPYSIKIRFDADFKVRDRETANQIASALRQLVEQCKVIPPAANNGPGLEETLGFIEDKLNGLGAVTWLSTLQDTVAGTSGSPVRISLQYSSDTGVPPSCSPMYHLKKLEAGKVTLDEYLTLTLRRIEKLAVMSMQDATNGYHARQGHPELVEVISPAMWELQVTGAANRKWDFAFTDQDLANRVAKAMLHAVELCEGGKEPF